MNRSDKMSEDKEKYHAEFIMESDGRLRLVYGNELYFSLFPPQNSPPDSELELYSSYLEKYMGHSYSLRKKRLFPGRKNLLWDELIEIDNPRLSIYGKAESDLSFPRDSSSGDNRKIIVIGCKDGHFFTEGASLDIPDSFPISPDLKSFESEILGSGNVKKLLSYCIRTGKVTSALGLLEKNNKSNYFCELHPYTDQEGGSHIAVMLNCVQHDLLSGGGFGCMPDDHMIAYGRITIIDGTEFFFSELNGPMTDALQKNILSLELIRSTDVFRSCVKYGASGSGVFLSAADGRQRFIMGVCPGEISGNRRDIIIFAFPAPPEESVRNDTVNELTPRELNILRLCSEGRTIKEISKMLNICESTAKCILSGAYKRIGAKSKTEAVMKFYGLLP